MGREGKHRLNKVSKFVVVSFMVAGALPLLAQQSQVDRPLVGRVCSKLLR